MEFKCCPLCNSKINLKEKEAICKKKCFKAMLLEYNNKWAYYFYSGNYLIIWDNNFMYITNSDFVIPLNFNIQMKSDVSLKDAVNYAKRMYKLKALA